LLLLLTPLVTNVMIHSNREVLSWIATATLLAWLFWCLRGSFGGAAQPIGKSVAGLLAGIVLVDWSAVPRLSNELALLFVGLFLLALLLQKRIPAT